MSESRSSGVLDTCAFIDLPDLDPAVLPDLPEITSVHALPLCTRNAEDFKVLESALEAIAI